jgi:hypothetical protein
MARKNYTPAERALHILGALADKSQQEINDTIMRGDIRKLVPPHRQKELPESSLDMLKGQYATALTSEVDWLRETKIGGEVWTDLWDHCIAPKKVGDL